MSRYIRQRLLFKSLLLFCKKFIRLQEPLKAILKKEHILNAKEKSACGISLYSRGDLKT